MNVYWYDWAGYLGVVLVLLAFFLLQERKLQGHGLVYQLMNIFGALGVILSLVFGASPVNWPAFLMEAAWVLISGYGIVRGVRLRRAARNLSNQSGI
jgi:paired small multidrug resistance pump